jgi:hypothetical protein
MVVLRDVVVVMKPIYIVLKVFVRWLKRDRVSILFFLEGVFSLTAIGVALALVLVLIWYWYRY